ncbi:hypothetical protein LTR53_001865 [Teratosphaeriaceae sp. CCFEE 6253]|nr:hypothetical protein LTR53_001865 [Teratosphaeriaceae sp. CCFEE 6253]
MLHALDMTALLICSGLLLLRALADPRGRVLVIRRRRVHWTGLRYTEIYFDARCVRWCCKRVVEWALLALCVRYWRKGPRVGSVVEEDGRVVRGWREL